MSVSRLNTLPLVVAAVLDDGTPDAITIQPGDAYIHVETGVILAFVLSDNRSARFLFALDHADRSTEPLREVIHVLRDSWFFRNLMKATPVGKAVRIGGFLLRHFRNWSKEPAGTGYYQQPDGKLIFTGTYQLTPR